MKKLIFVYVLVLSACASRGDYVRQRAPFDLNCNPDKVAIADLGGTTYGATGCGRKVTYNVKGYCDGIGWCKVEKEATEIKIIEE